MDMADYSEALDPAYTTLEFENMQVLPLGTGESHRCSAELWNLCWFKTLAKRGQKESWHEVIKGRVRAVGCVYHLWARWWNIKRFTVEIRRCVLVHQVIWSEPFLPVSTCRLMWCRLDYSRDVFSQKKQKSKYHDHPSPVTNGPFPQTLKWGKGVQVFQVILLTPAYLYMQSPMTSRPENSQGALTF